MYYDNKMASRDQCIPKKKERSIVEQGSSINKQVSDIDLGYITGYDREISTKLSY